MGITSVSFDKSVRGPAASYLKSGKTLLNPKWRGYAQDHRFYILLHEKGHISAQNANEFEADARAFRDFVEMGYDPDRAVTALSQVLTMSNPEHYARVAAQQKRADAYKKNGLKTFFTGMTIKEKIVAKVQDIRDKRSAKENAFTNEAGASIINQPAAPLVVSTLPVPSQPASQLVVSTTPVPSRMAVPAGVQHTGIGGYIPGTPGHDFISQATDMVNQTPEGQMATQTGQGTQPPIGHEPYMPHDDTPANPGAEAEPQKEPVLPNLPKPTKSTRTLLLVAAVVITILLIAYFSTK